MAFVLDPSTSIQRSVRRVARERIDDAQARLADLDDKAPDAIEEAVHETRKRCKEVRALARLVRDPLGPGYARFNDDVREAAAQLSSIRDAHAILGTFDDLRASRDAIDDPDLAVIRTGQADAAVAATRGLGADDPRIVEAGDRLESARRRIKRWHLPDDPAVLADGVEEVYRRGRRCLGKARKRPTDERLHEWRKSVKALWYHLRLLQAAAPSVLDPLVARLDDLADALGDDHDLSVLVEKLQASPRRFGGKKRVAYAVSLARVQQGDLRRRAFRLGATLYAEEPEAFADRVETYWRNTVASGPELATGGIAELIAEDRKPRKNSEKPAVGAIRPPASRGSLARFFLLEDPPDLPRAGVDLREGYLAIDGRASVRVRDEGGYESSLDIRSGRGAERNELEWPISPRQFEAAWSQTQERRISRTRYRVDTAPAGGDHLDVDVYHDELDGLVMARIGFESVETLESFEPPAWFGREVTDDPLFTNAALAVNAQLGVGHLPGTPVAN